MMDERSDECVKKFWTTPGKFHKVFERMEQFQNRTDNETAEIHEGCVRVTVLEQVIKIEKERTRNQAMNSDTSIRTNVYCCLTSFGRDCM